MHPADGRQPVRGSVLLVDDEPQVLASLREVLAPARVRVRLAESSTHAFALMAEELPMLVISDYLMPEMDGLAFLKRVGMMYPDVRRVLFTASTDFPRVYGLDVPVLSKPCNPENLRQIVEDLVR